MGRRKRGIGRGWGGSRAPWGSWERVWEGPEAGGGSDGDVVALACAVGVCGEEGVWGRGVHGTWMRRKHGTKATTQVTQQLLGVLVIGADIRSCKIEISSPLTHPSTC